MPKRIANLKKKNDRSGKMEAELLTDSRKKKVLVTR